MGTLTFTMAGETGEIEQTLAAYTLHRCIAWLAPCCSYLRAPTGRAAREATLHCMTGYSPVPVMHVFVCIWQEMNRKEAEI